MAINKAFVVKNGFEVSTDLILANADTRRVGVGFTNPQFLLDVAGGIGATDFYLTGIGTFVDTLNVGLGGTVLTVLGVGNSIGIGTALPAYLLDIRSPVSTGQTALYVEGDVRITGDLSLDDVTLDDAEIQDLTVTDTFIVAGLSTFNSNVFIDADLNVSGVTTLGAYVDINDSVDIAVDLNVVGLTTLGGYVDINNSVDISGALNVVGLTTLATVDINAGDIEVSNVDTTDLYVSGISTLGTVLINSGIITAASGIVTYYGDGQYLDLTNNSSTGIGIGTTGGIVGYGITFINFYGTGVSSAFYDSGVGIATIFFEGGGGGSGTIGIGTEFPISSVNGDLFYSAEYGRIFVYYDELEIGIGTDAYWVDAAPFNVGIITSLTNVSFAPGSAVDPSMYFIGYPTTGFFSPGSGQFTIVSSGSSILNINPNGIVVTGVATIGNVTVGGATTDLIVNGDARVTGILTVGSSSLTLNGDTNTINGVTISSGIITASSFVGALTGNATGLSGTPNLTVGVVTATSFSGAVTGTATSTTNIPNLSGDLTSANTVTTLATVNGNTGSFGSGSAIPTITVNAKGLITAVTTTAVTSGTTITDDTSTDATRYIVFEDITSGTSSAANVSSTKLTYNPSTGTLTAIDLNATSDINLKENIHTVENALETVSSLRGVSFDWKETGKSSYGVIAQELEEILPELVKQGEVKSVNYNGIIGVLIEAVKELKKEVEELKKTK